MNAIAAVPLRARFLETRLFDFTGVPITVTTLIVFALIVLVSLLASWGVRTSLRHAFHRRGFHAEGSLASTLRLLHYVILAVGIAVALETIGVDLGFFFAAGAIFAIAIGFALQDIVRNFVSGVILLFERTITPGDVLRIDDRVVRVERMRMRATVVRTLDDEDMIVPNGTIVQSTVTNYTLRDSIHRVRTTVSVPCGADVPAVKQALERAAAALAWRLQDRRPVVLLTELGESSLRFEVSVWIDDPWRMRSARSELNEAIWRGLSEAGAALTPGYADARGPGRAEARAAARGEAPAASPRDAAGATQPPEMPSA